MANKFILIAEDDRFHADIYKYKLEKEGYTVQICGNGEELVEGARKHKPDLIILDLIMPVKDGFYALKEVKNDPNLNHIPVLIISNLGQKEDTAKARDLGATDYLIKAHTSVKEILDRVQSLLANQPTD
jgi:DNA-binding response OmpR family regulator